MIMGPKSKPPISPSDPLYTEKLWAWKILQDAVCKSCLTNDLMSNKVLGSIEAIKYMTESRGWIMDMGLNMVGDPLADDMVAGFECGFCVELLGFRIETFKEFIAGAWRERNTNIVDALKRRLAVEESRRASFVEMKKKSKVKQGRIAGKENSKAITDALRMVAASRKWS